MPDYNSIILSINRVIDICNSKIKLIARDIKDYKKVIRNQEAEMDDLQRRQYQGPYVSISIHNQAVKIQESNDKLKEYVSCIEKTDQIAHCLADIVHMLQQQRKSKTSVSYNYALMIEAVNYAIDVCTEKIGFYKNKNSWYEATLQNIEKANTNNTTIDTSGIQTTIKNNENVINKYVQDIQNLNVVMDIVVMQQRLNTANILQKKYSTTLAGHEI